VRKILPKVTRKKRAAHTAKTISSKTNGGDENKGREADGG
jgi:hypothetical protein